MLEKQSMKRKKKTKHIRVDQTSEAP